MLNKILRYFGLMKIRTARNITSRMHIHYVKCVNDGVLKDFGVNPALDAIPKASKWWMDTFTEIVEIGNDDVLISNPAQFD